MTEKEYESALTRFYRLVNIYDAMLKTVDGAFKEDRRWFVFCVRLARKHLTHCKSMCLNAATTFVYEDGTEKKETEFRDIPGLFMNVRTQSDTYAILHHIFFDEVDWEIKRLRFDLWRLDSSIQRYQQQSDYSADELRIMREALDAALGNQEYALLTPAQKELVLKESEDPAKIRANWKFIPERLTSRDARISWRDIFCKAGLKEEIFQNSHAFFSLYVHSSFFSVNHLCELTEKDALAAKNFAVTFSSFLVSFAIDDFTSKFSAAREFCDGLPKLDKEVIGSFLAGGRESSHIKYFR